MIIRSLPPQKKNHSSANFKRNLSKLLSTTITFPLLSLSVPVKSRNKSLWKTKKRQRDFLNLSKHILILVFTVADYVPFRRKKSRKVGNNISNLFPILDTPARNLYAMKKYSYLDKNICNWLFSLFTCCTAMLWNCQKSHGNYPIN